MSMYGSGHLAAQALANEYVRFRLSCCSSLGGRVCTVQGTLLVKHWQMSMYGSDCLAGQALAVEYLRIRLPC